MRRGAGSRLVALVMSSRGETRGLSMPICSPVFAAGRDRSMSCLVRRGAAWRGDECLGSTGRPGEVVKLPTNRCSAGTGYDRLATACQVMERRSEQTETCSPDGLAARCTAGRCLSRRVSATQGDLSKSNCSPVFRAGNGMCNAGSGSGSDGPRMAWQVRSRRSEQTYLLTIPSGVPSHDAMRSDLVLWCLEWRCWARSVESRRSEQTNLLTSPSGIALPDGAGLCRDRSGSVPERQGAVSPGELRRVDAGKPEQAQLLTIHPGGPQRCESSRGDAGCGQESRVKDAWGKR